MSTIYQSGISYKLLEYVGLRVGRINSCELCIGKSLVRVKDNPTVRDCIEYVLNWEASRKFNEAEEAALALTEAITKLEKKYESVSDELWSKIEKPFGEQEKAALVLFISVMNMFTRST